MKKVFSLLLTVCFAAQQLGFAQMTIQPGAAQSALVGSAAERFRPVHLRSVSFAPTAGTMKFLIDRGDVNSGDAAALADSKRQVFEFFLIGIALPNDAFWVNLRPDSPQEIIDPRLEKTDMGRILLAADLQLKKDMALLTSPDTSIGKEYWQHLYARAEQLFGPDLAEIPALTRPWIVPNEVIIAQGGAGAYVYKATLNVMLEQDYLKGQAQFNFDDPRTRQLNEYSSELVRSLILPRLVRDVNTSRRYASLRQVYYSLILAQWFKQKYAGTALKQASLFAGRLNTGNLDGLTSRSAWSKNTYFQEYQKSFRQGEYNKQEQFQTGSGIVVRSYVSGGAVINVGAVLKDPRTTIPVSDKSLEVASVHNQEFIVDGDGVMADGPARSPRDGGLVAEDDGSIKAEIEELIAGKEAELIGLVKEYDKADSVEQKAAIEKKINDMVDLVNVFNRYAVDDLGMAPVENLDEFLVSGQAGKFIELAEQTLLEGKYVPEFIFAGAATRLFDSLKTILENGDLDPKDFRMYSLDLWDVVEILQQNMDKVKKHSPDLVPLLEQTEVPVDRQPLGMGSRQIATYKKYLEGLAASAGIDPAKVLARQSMVLHINEEVADTVIEDFIKNDFYGFNPQKVFFIIQPVFGGYRLTDKGLVFDESSAKLPFGHGFVAMQLVAPGQAFTVNAAGQRVYMDGTVMDYLSDVQKATVIGEHRVNDLTKFSFDDVVNIDKLAFSLSKIAEGKNIITDLVENPGGQKGGNMVVARSLSRKFLIETSNTNGSPVLTKMIEDAAADGAEYNAMRSNAAVTEYRSILREGIPYNLRFKNGLFYLESVKGDSTQSPLAVVDAVVKPHALIHDFKALGNLAEAVGFLTDAGYFQYFTPQEMVAWSKERSVVLGIIAVRPELKGLWDYVEKSYAQGDLSEWRQAYDTLVLVDQWLANPWYRRLFPKLADKLDRMIVEGDWETITECFYQVLGFGTAGKRGHQAQESTGEVLPGVNVINDFTVAEFALGLVRYIQGLEKHYPGISQRGIVIGGDTRIKSITPYNDEEPYAHLVAKIARAMNVKVYLFNGPRSIAEVSWFTTHVGALGMVYVSASHNYWYDNGIKSSNEVGAQLFPAEKAAIVEQMGTVTIEDIANLGLDKVDLRQERAAAGNGLVVLGSAEEKTAGAADEDVDSQFIQVNADYQIDAPMVKEHASEVRSFYTPVQGAGRFTIGAILKDQGFSASISKVQVDQDSQGRFDTVLKPDPAHVEDGVRTLDVAIAEAESLEKTQGKKFDFVVGTDPDADRSAYAVRDNEGKWAVLKANDVWSMFTWYMLTQMKKQGILPKHLIKTWVTSDLIKDIARSPDFGLNVFEPAVGFDKIAQVALKEIALPLFYAKHGLGPYGKQEKTVDPSLDLLVKMLDDKGVKGATPQSVIKEINAILRDELAFGAEESNGFSPGGHTLEKDGAVAVVMFHEVAAFVKHINAHKNELGTVITDARMHGILQDYFFKNSELNIYNFLNALYLRYGYFATANIPLEFEGLTGNRQKELTLDRINEVAKAMQAGKRKLSFGANEVASATSGQEATQCGDVSFPEIGYKFALKGDPANWITTRPSGTEPYIRFYGQLKITDGLTWDTIEQIKKDADKKVVELVEKAQQAFGKDGGQGLKDLFNAAGVQNKNDLPENNPFKEIGFEGDTPRLGWVVPPSWEDIEPVFRKALAAKTFREKLRIVFTGMGGSINTVKAIIKYFGRGDSSLIYAIDSLDPAAIAELMLELSGDMKNVGAVGISKTTSTAETRKIMRMIRQGVKRFAGEAGSFAWMSDPSNYGKLLDGRDADDQWPGVDTMPIQPKNEDIGGRFTAPHTFIFLIPLMLVLGQKGESQEQKLAKMEKIWAEYIAMVKTHVASVEKQAAEAAQSEKPYYAVVVKNKKMARALETWIIQLFQESLGSKQEGYNPKVVVVTEDELGYYKGFTPLRFDVPTENDEVKMMTTMYLSQVFVALLAREKAINFVIQPEVEKYKNKASGIEYQPADVVDMDALTASVIAASEGKNFIEVVCYWYLPDEQRQAIMDHLREKCPGKTVLVFEGSDWNHHSYQAATMNDETLFVVLTKDRYLEHVEGIPDATLQENTENLLDIAYATYETLKDKAVYLALRTPAAAETIHDGGSAKAVGGVDFRRVPGTALPVSVSGVPAFVSQSNGNIDLDKQWQQLVACLSSGSLPSAESVKEYAAGCCKAKQAGKPVNKPINDIAELLRMQEDHVCATESELKEALAYLSS